MYVRLADPVDLHAFRLHARQLLANGVPPDRVEWGDGGARDGDGDLFGDAHACASKLELPATPATATPHAVPASFVALCGDVILHRDAQRFALLYRLLWRLAHEPALRHDPLDADMMQAQQMAKAVHRDIHKMRAFVRFTRIAGDDGLERHVADRKSVV